jgi:integrase
MTETKPFKFTTRNIESMQVGKRTDFTDPSQKGLTLRVTPLGAKTWALLYRRKSDGKKRRVTIGEFSEKGLAEARAAAVELRAEINRGEDPAAKRTALRKLATIDEVLDRYLKDYAEPHKRSAFEDRRTFDKDVRPYIGQHKVGTVTRQDVVQLLNRIKDRGAGIAANRALSKLRKAFNWARAEGYMTDNPASGLAPRVKERKRERVLSSDEIYSFWHGLDAAGMKPGTKLALKLALVTGQRIGEVCGAEKRELDLDKADWLIPASHSKNGRQHAVPLSALAVELFRQALAHSGDSRFVFPAGPGTKGEKPLASHSIGGATRKALKELGLADAPATPHDLRRTVASHLAAMGFGENIVARILNHSSVTERTITGSVYIRHSFAAEKRQALEAWANELDRIIKKTKLAPNVVKLQPEARKAP